MAPYQPTHLPYGLKDPAKRVIRNPGLKDEANFLRYGVETGGDHFSVRVTVKGGGGELFGPFQIAFPFMSMLILTQASPSTGTTATARSSTQSRALWASWARTGPRP